MDEEDGHGGEMMAELPPIWRQVLSETARMAFGFVWALTCSDAGLVAFVMCKNRLTGGGDGGYLAAMVGRIAIASEEIRAMQAEDLLVISAASGQRVAVRVTGGKMKRERARAETGQTSRGWRYSPDRLW